MNCTQQHRFQQLLETITAMRNQEERYYRITDNYLSSPLLLRLPNKDEAVDESCRSLMIDWCNSVAKACQYSPETVEIAVNYLDRFLSTPCGLKILRDRDQFQLAAVTAFYSAVKIHEQEAIDPNLLSVLCQGKHTPNDIEEMESKILNALSWRVNPPTTRSFARMILEMILPDDQFTPYERRIIEDKTEEQIVVISNGYDFTPYPNSYLAFASVLNSIDDDICSHFQRTIGQIIRVENHRCIRQLQMMIYQKQGNGNKNQVPYDYDDQENDVQNYTTDKNNDVTKPTYGLSSMNQSRKSPRSVQRNSIIAQAA